MKLGENENIQIYLNCEDKAVTIDIRNFSEVVYSRKWKAEETGSGILEPNGILILRY